jgi:ComF family protein
MNRVRSLLHWAGLSARRCQICGEPAPDGERLCPACAERLQPERAPRCRLCGASFPDEDGGLCAACTAAPPLWEALYFHGRYEGLLRELILEYKFGRNLGLGRLLMGLAADAAPGGGAWDMLVPAPLHPSRLRWRGFNQSRELCRLLARRTGAPVVDRALSRIRGAAPQSVLDKEQRRSNVAGAFRANAALATGRSILLADDVMTTGATLSECARVLLEAGAARVAVLVLARD